MEKLYIGLVDTPGLFAWMIRKAIRQDYIHVVLGMDEMLDECYSVGRRFPSIPLLAGFEREEKEKIMRAFLHRRAAFYFIAEGILPGETLYLCLLYCPCARGEWIKAFFEAFFIGNSKRFL